MREVTVKVHAASLDSLPPAPPDSQERLVCVCEIERSARLHTREIRYTSEPGGERTAVSVSFEEDLSFHVGHADRAQHLKLVLFRPSDGSRVYVAAGSLGLEPLLHSDAAQRHSVSVPVVDEVGKHAGEVGLTLHLAEAAAAAQAGEAAEQGVASPAELGHGF